MKNNLSDTVYDMLSNGKKVDTIKDKEEIKKIFIDQGIPLFDKIVEFQELYGGIWYKIGSVFYEGFRMNIIYFNEREQKYKLNYHKKIDGKYYFNCMDYHYAGDIGPCIDEDGKIYAFGMGQVLVRADNIEDFLEDEAIKYYFVNKNPTWLNRGAKKSKIDEFKKTNALSKIDRKSFSDKYFEWWCNTDETIFIRINLVSKFECTYADVYCKDKKVLEQLYKSNIAASVYPSE